MRKHTLNVLGLGALMLVAFGCTTSTVNTVDPMGLESGPRTGMMTRAKLSHLNAITSLAANNERGIFVRISPQNLARFRAIEAQGLSIKVDGDVGSHDFHRMIVEKTSGSSGYVSRTGRQRLIEESQADHIVILDFGAAPGGMATCSEVVPVYRPDVAALSVTMDLDKIDATNEFTDVADETYGLLALTDDWREFWSSNVKGKEGLELDEAKMIYDSPKRQTALYRKALQAESECRRERYFEWTAEVFKQFEAGRTTEFPQKDAPGFVRPFELQTGRLAKDHTAYHRPHIINSDGQQVYCKIRAGKHMSGSPRVFKLPYVPPIPGEQDSDVLTMSEYKARWQRAFKDQLIQEGEYSPYSASVHPDNVRFPDAATPPAFFMQALTAGGAQDAQAAQALDASTVAIRK